MKTRTLHLFMAAIMLLGVQSASAFGYKNASDGWTAVLTTFAQQESFYSGGNNEANQWYVLMGINPGEGFNIYQNDDASGQMLYVGLGETAAASEHTIVRATCKWDNNLFANLTVVLPEGKIWVAPDNGSPVLMTHVGNYLYEAILPLAASVDVYGEDVATTAVNAESGMAESGVPASLKLSVADVPVSATASKIRVKYNLWWNQVTVEDFVSEYCDWTYTSDATADDKNVLFTWETLPNGNVVISIAPGEGTDAATFRGANGLAPDGFKVNGNANTGNAYFQHSLNTEKTQITLVPQQNIPEGAQITHNALMEWLTTGSNNEYTFTAPFTTPYTYGSNCSGVYVTKLATPTNVAVDASNVLTFTEAPNANTYIVAIKFGAATLKTLNVTGSGETLSLPFSGNFDVTVTASDNTATYANSDASAPYAWILAVADAPAGNSVFCETVLGNGAIISIETADAADGNIEIGDIVVTIAGDGAAFRGNGMQLNPFVIGGINGVNVLTKVSAAGANPQVFRPVAGIAVAGGTLITYNNGLIEYLTASNNNAYGNFTFSNYVYGSACDIPQLDPPTSLALGAGNTLTFTPDASAASTTVYVYAGESKLLELPNFTSGSAVHFPLNGSFSVYARSITGSVDYLNSELSDGVALTVALSDASVGYSEYCRYAFDPEGEGAYPNDSDLAYLTWTTADNGDILVGIEGTTENAETTAFRAPGLFIADITVGGLSAVNLLTITYSDSQLTLSPVAGISIPKGTVIAVNDGMVTYRVLPLGTPETELDNLWPRATLYYTYGSVCQFTAMDEATAANDPVVSTEYYNLQGVRIAGEALHATFLRSGIYIVKKMHESGKAEASKIVIK